MYVHYKTLVLIIHCTRSSSSSRRRTITGTTLCGGGYMYPPPPPPPSFAPVDGWTPLETREKGNCSVVQQPGRMFVQ